MVRPLRIEYENASYHITVRGNERRTIFRDDYDRDIFLEIIQAAYNRFNFIIHAFVLMDNHFHLLMETPDANLSASMHHINGVYTQAFNRRYNRAGHLFQGRYKSIVVDCNEYYLELIRYIHLNPWHARMERRLGAFKYSGHSAIMSKKWADRWKGWYDIGSILKEFGRREKEAIRRYREFVEAGKGMKNPLEKTIGGYALGGKEFADWLWEEFIEGREDKEITMPSEMRPRIEISALVSAVGSEYDLTEADIFKKGNNTIGMNEGRGMVLFIMNRHTGMTQREIGKLAGGIKRAAVSEMVRRFKRLVEEDDETRKIYQRIMKTLR
jgi:REP element-mobilizing transposase RayT